MLFCAKDLHFSYRRQPVLQGISLSLDRGEVVAVLGPNGCGKSTLLHALLGHLPIEGHVAWEGRDVRDWPRRSMARLAAYLPQTPMFEARQTALDVLRLGRTPHLGLFGLESHFDLAIVMRIARQLNLEGLLDRPMDELSSGQRQRVFIGRCLAQEPQALLLDEPDTFLDVRRQLDLWRLLRQLSKDQGVGVLIVTHAINTAAALADRLALLHEGRVAADGRPEAVLEPQLLSRIWDAPMQRLDLPPDQPPIVVPRISSPW